MERSFLISACLLGIPCRYDGNSRVVPELIRLINHNQVLIPFCPETQGGLGIPRPPAEIVGGDGWKVLEGKARVINQKGVDCTESFLKGAETVLGMAEELKPQLVIVKSKSPSCGLGKIYDGSFSRSLTLGDGVTVALLKQAHMELCTESELLKIMPHIIR